MEDILTQFAASAGLAGRWHRTTTHWPTALFPAHYDSIPIDHTAAAMQAAYWNLTYRQMLQPILFDPSWVSIAGGQLIPPQDVPNSKVEKIHANGVAIAYDRPLKGKPAYLILTAHLCYRAGHGRLGSWARAWDGTLAVRLWVNEHPSRDSIQAGPLPKGDWSLRPPLARRLV